MTPWPNPVIAERASHGRYIGSLLSMYFSCKQYFNNKVP